MKEKDKAPEEELSEVEVIGNLFNKKLKVTIVKMIKEIQRRVDEQSEELEVFKKAYTKRNEIEMKNLITEMKNTPERTVD